MSNVMFQSVIDRLLGRSKQGNLVGNDIQITMPCVNASITVGAESTNVRAITIQLKDINGDDIAYRQVIKAYVFADANGDAFVGTGGSTGIAIGTDGALLPLVAKKAFTLISEADGDIDLTWTDTGTEVAYLALEMPNGRLIFSDALTNA